MKVSNIWVKTGGASSLYNKHETCVAHLGPGHRSRLEKIIIIVFSFSFFYEIKAIWEKTNLNLHFVMSAVVKINFCLFNYLSI